MKTIALLLVVVLVACVGNSSAVEKKLAAVPKAPVQVDFKKLEGANALTKERLEQFRKAVEAFNSKIEGTRMNAAHKDAVKQQALERVLARLDALKRTPKKVEA